MGHPFLEARPGPLILDTTLRDGSYVLNFQFTLQQTAEIAGALDRIGIPLIEVGHGIGLGAWRNPRYRSAHTDAEYMQATSGAVRDGAWGMFCIPGISTLDDLEIAIDHGMRFIRVGTNITEYRTGMPFIERAKQAGMIVCANYMKSYAVAPDVFADIAAGMGDHGLDAVYIVDSAGGMLPADVRRYHEALRARSDLPIGFHGHNNLGLAVANSLLAVELGARIVDSSLQGLGRSAGNTPTEMLVLALERAGIACGIDVMAMLDAGEELIRPLLRRAGSSSIDLVAGYGQFHSSYMGVIREFADRHDIDPRRLILAVTEIDRMNAPRELVGRLAALLAAKPKARAVPERFRLDEYYGDEQNDASRPDQLGGGRK